MQVPALIVLLLQVLQVEVLLLLHLLQSPLLRLCAEQRQRLVSAKDAQQGASYLSLRGYEAG